MPILRHAFVAAALLAGCTSPERIRIEPDSQSDKADGLPSDLDVVDDHRVDFDEPSDLAFWDKKLFAVSDRHSRLYEMDDDGDIRGTQDIKGSDMEALAIDDEGRVYVGDESEAKVWRLDDNGDREKSYDIDTTSGNSGVEGLAFDDKNVMYVAKEKSPSTIFMIDRGSEKELDHKEINFADDISALAFNPDDEHIYALSDEEQKLWRLDSHFDHITSWKLPIEHPEGLAFDDDGKTLYIVSDSEERLYILELD
jgi:uncharacterized protein YjiK